MSVFTKNTHFCIITKNSDYELDDLYNFRGKFIINQVINNNDTFEHIIRLSNYASNIEFLNCVYSREIHDEYTKLKLKFQ